MLTLYSKGATSFSTLGIGVLRDFISHPLITEELNGAYTLEFEYAKDGYLSEYLIEQNIIKADGQAFRIWNIKKDMQKITVFAKHIFFDLSFNFLADVFPTNLTAQSALEWMLNRAAVATNFSATGNCTQTASTRYVRKNFIDAVFNEDNALLKKFGGELSYDNFNITVHDHRGTNANFSIRYKKNLTGIDFNLDFSNVATRIVPIGFDGLTIDSTYVESPRASNYFTPLYKTYEFNDIKYDPDDEEAYHTLAEAKQALINAANDLFTKNVDLPQVSIGVNFVELSKCSEYASYSNLERVHLGDTIDVIIPELNIHTSARVNKTVYDCILGRFITLEIGSAKQSIARTQIVIENQIRKSENYLTQAQQNAENLINHPFNGNVYIDKENGVIYLMDSTSPETAQNVWKWSLGGLGFSSTGINGTYTVAILQDGRINADFITTGQLDTGVIQGYDSLLIQVDTLDREFQKEINPTGVASGSSITLEDSAEADLIEFELEGKTVQDGTPTPTNPVEFVSVGYQNLLKGSSSEWSQWYTPTYNVQNISTYLYFTTENLQKFKQGQKFTLSFDVEFENVSGTSERDALWYPQIVINPTLDGMHIGQWFLFSNESPLYLNPTDGVHHMSHTFTLNNDFTNYVRYGFVPRLDYWASGRWRIRNVQLQVGDTANSYIPYGKYGIEIKTSDNNNNNNTYLYTLDNPLRSIGDTKDLLYIKNGILYVERFIGDVVLNGTESWTRQNDNRFWLVRGYWNDANVPKNPVSSEIQGLYCNRFQEVTMNQTWLGVEGISYDNANTTEMPVGSSFDISCNSIATTLEDFLNWLSANNVEVEYLLQNPYIEELGKVQIPSTYKGITNLNTTDDLEPNMNITYVRDTLISNYVESHVSELKITENGIESRVQTIEDGDYGTRINAVEQRTTDTEHSIDIISTNIDTTTGEVRRVTTTTGFKFDENGMSIEDSNSNFKALHRNTGTTYYDGTDVVGQYTKDGSKQKDLELFGVYYYGKNDINDTPMFIAQLFTDGNGEVGFGHFYNGGD